MAINDEHALRVLKNIRESNAPEIPEQLLRGCYDLYKQLQFETDMASAHSKTRNLVTEYVEQLMDRPEK